MNILLIFFLITTILPLIILFIAFYKDIFSFFKPQDYVRIYILELDNQITRKLIKKPSNLKYKYKSGVYNLFDTHKNIPNFKNKETVIYRDGRLNALFFIEGNSNPLDFRTGKIQIDTYLEQEFNKLDMAKLWSTNKPFGMTLLEQYGFYLILGIIILVIIAVFK